MASTDNIEILYGGTWRKDEADFHKSVDNMVADIDKITTAGKNIKIDFGGLDNAAFKKVMSEAAGIISELKARIKELDNATKSHTKSDLEAEKVAQAKAKTDREQIRALREKNKAIYDARKEQERLEKVIVKEEATIRKNVSAYALLNAEYQKHAAKAKEMATIYGTEDVMAKRAAEAANRLNDRLKKIDATVGQSQRKVGDYQTAWQGLGFSIQQLVREVPSTMTNLSMLPLALSNNIGPLIDELKRARQANELLKASGKSAIPVWKQVAASVFSWQTALMAGIAVLVAYSSSSGSAAKKVGDLSEALKSAASDYAEARIKLEAWNEELANSTTTATRKEAILKEYNNTLGEHMGKQESVLGLEKRLTSAAPAYIEAMKHRAIAAAALAASMDILTESMKNQSNKGEDLVSGWDKVTGAVVGFVKNPIGGIGVSSQWHKDQRDALANDEKSVKERTTNLEKIINENQAKAQAIMDKFGFNFDPKTAKPKKQKEAKDLTNVIIEAQREMNDALYAINTENMEAMADFDKSVSENEKNSIEERLQAYENYLTYKELIAEEAMKRELRDIELQNEKIKHSISESNATPLDKANALVAVEQSHLEQISALGFKYDRIDAERRTKSEEDKVKILESSTKEQLRVIMQGAQEIENRLIDGENKRLMELEQKYQEGNITYKQYQEERKRITAYFDQQIFYSQKKHFEGYIDDLEKQGKLTVEVAREIRKALAKELPKSGKEEERTIFGLGKEELGQIQETYSYTISAINSISDAKQAAKEREIAAHEATIERIKKEEAAEILKIQAMGLADKEEAEAIAKTKAFSLAKQRQEEVNIITLKRKQAAADKQANINEVIGKTAIAAMQAYIAAKNPILGAFYAAAVLAAGYGQVQAISNRPLPQYAVGTKSKPESGAAIVGEKGSEAYRLPTGQWGVTPSTATVMDLPKGTEIFTAEKTNEMMKAGALKSLAASGKKVNEWEYMRAMVAATEASGRRIERAIQGQKPPIININGISAYAQHKRNN